MGSRWGWVAGRGRGRQRQICRVRGRGRGRDVGADAEAADEAEAGTGVIGGRCSFVKSQGGWGGKGGGELFNSGPSRMPGHVGFTLDRDHA